MKIAINKEEQVLLFEAISKGYIETHKIKRIIEECKKEKEVRFEFPPFDEEDIKILIEENNKIRHRHNLPRFEIKIRTL